MIDVPEDAEAPVILPLLIPIVHSKVLVAVALRLMFGELPLQTDAVTAVVRDGVAITVNATLFEVSDLPQASVTIQS